MVYNSVHLLANSSCWWFNHTTCPCGGHRGHFLNCACGRLLFRWWWWWQWWWGILVDLIDLQALHLVWEGFNYGIGKDGLGMNGSFESVCQHSYSWWLYHSLVVCHMSCLAMQHNTLTPMRWSLVCYIDQYIRTFTNFISLSNTALVIVELIKFWTLMLFILYLLLWQKWSSTVIRSKM